MGQSATPGMSTIAVLCKRWGQCGLEYLGGDSLKHFFLDIHLSAEMFASNMHLVMDLTTLVGNMEASFCKALVQRRTLCLASWLFLCCISLLVCQSAS